MVTLCLILISYLTKNMDALKNLGGVKQLTILAKKH
jgi:hypothetical protein